MFVPARSVRKTEVPSLKREKFCEWEFSFSYHTSSPAKYNSTPPILSHYRSPPKVCNTMLVKSLLSLLLAAAAALGSASQAPIANNPTNLGDHNHTLPIYTLLPCPASCPCCEGCELLRDQCGLEKRTTYNTVRNLVGCDSLPLDTRLCPVGKCSKRCLCREKLLRTVEDALLEDGHGCDDEDEPESSPAGMSSLEQTFPNRLQPWYLVKPPCPGWCICCEWCDCTGYLTPPGTFRSVRMAVGCDSVPATTALCPVGKCREGCVCREGLLRELEGALFNMTEEADGR